MDTDAATAAQPLLFDSLPETEAKSGRRKPRRARAAPEPVAVDSVSEPVPPATPPPLLAVPQPVAAPVPQPPSAPAALDPAALTNPELRALLRALPDLRLGYLLTEAARELKNRVQPGDMDEDGAPIEPNPSLLRAARQAVAELSGEDD